MLQFFEQFQTAATPKMHKEAIVVMYVTEMYLSVLKHGRTKVDWMWFMDKNLDGTLALLCALSDKHVLSIQVSQSMVQVCLTNVCLPSWASIE